MIANTPIQIQDETRDATALKAWVVCLSAALFFFYEFIQMGMFNSISPQLMKDFSIDATQLGYLSATYFYADVIFLFFAGMILDKVSTRKVIISAMALCVTATLVFSLSTSLWVAATTHFVAGIGNAFCLLSCIKLASRWFSTHRMALVIGITVTIGMAGGVFAQTPLTLLVHAFGWRHAVILDAALGAIILLIIMRFVHDKHEAPVENKSSKSPMKLSETIRFALCNSQNWLGGIYTCLLNLPILLLGELWGMLYLTQVQHVSRMDASYLASMIFIGTIVGCTVVGAFSDYCGKRRFPMILGAILSLMTILGIMYLPNLSVEALVFLFFALGFFTSTQIISYPAIAESNPKIMTGTATGLAAVLIMGGGAVFQPLFGWLMDFHRSGLMMHGVMVYSHADYMRGMMIMPIAIFVGLLASLIFRETNCQPYREK
jgi:MFS family permease